MSPELHPAILECIFGSASDAMLVAAPNGRFLLCNAAAERLLGVWPGDDSFEEWSERVSLRCGDTLTPCPRGQTPLERALRGETPGPMELFAHPAASGRGVWVSASAAPVYDAEGRFQGALAPFRDISQDKRTEEALRREGNWASAIIETVASPIVVLDRDGRIVSFNRACEEATGYTFQEVHGRRVWDFLLIPEEADEVRQVFAALAGGDFPSQHENYWLGKDGRRRLISWSNTTVCDPQGNVEYVLAAGIDVTERARAKEDLQQTADTLRAVIDTSPLAIVAMDLDGTVRSWNRAAERMFGWTEEEVVGHRFPIVPDDDAQFFVENQDRLRYGETIAGIERQRRRKDGTLVDVALWNAPRRDASGGVIGAISVIADVSERKRLEEQFRQSQKMEAIGRLAGGVAHDFNNLLTVITGYTQMLVDELEPGDPKRDYVDEIVHASESATALTNQLLAFSRRQIISPQVLDLNTLVTNMEGMMHRLIGEDVELIASLGQQLPKIKVDAGQFQQVLMNLLVNARDAMPGGGKVTIESSTTTVGENHPDGVAPGSYVTLTVSDTGKGMPDDVRRRAFEPFFTTKGRGKGTGLGLSTVYGIVKQAGGDVTISSSPGAGSTFRIFLPSIDEAVAAGVEAPGAERKPKTGTETILVVEDEAGLRKLIREILSNNGYTVLEAADAGMAIEFCEAHAGPIDLVLTDCVLPGMSGSDLAGRASALRPKASILYMSGYAERDAFGGPGPAPGEPFLEKPFTPDVLLKKVRDILDR